MGYATIQQAAYAISDGIGDAEGYFNSDPNVIPRMARNPGDICIGDYFDLGVLGEGITIFPGANPESDINNPEDGWAWLRRMIMGWYELKSHIYTPKMTIQVVASHYTTTNQVGWADAVAEKLGVQPTDTLASLLNPGVLG